MGFGKEVDAMPMTPETRRKIEEQLEQVEERKRQQVARANAKAARLRAKLAKEDRAIRTHRLVELGAGLETLANHATESLFVGGKEQDLVDRELNQRVWNTVIHTGDGRALPLISIVEACYRREIERRGQKQTFHTDDDRTS